MIVVENSGPIEKSGVGTESADTSRCGWTSYRTIAVENRMNDIAIK